MSLACYFKYKSYRKDIMAIIPDITSSILAVEMLNGRMHPNRINKPSKIIAAIFLALVFCGGILLFIVGIIGLDLELILISVIGIIAFVYLFLISPYGQKVSDYNIRFKSRDSLADFTLTYKGKEVAFLYKIDKDGKIMFSDNAHKLNCVSYRDGSKMSNFTKYRIMNFFSKWLMDNKLLSDNVTVTFEKL